MSLLPKLLLVAAGVLFHQSASRAPDRRRKDSTLRSTAEDWARNRRRRRPPEAGLAVPAVPPKGPLPKKGGAEAPLDIGA